MKSSKTRGLVSSSVLLLAMSGAVIPPNYDYQAKAQTVTQEKRSKTTWEWNDDGWRRRVEIQGKAEFNDDYSDITDVSNDGSVRIEEIRGGDDRRLDIRKDASGQLVRKYLVNGELTTLDAKGREWLAGLLLIAVRQGTIDADRRVEKILKQRGVAGMLDEISSIEGEYGKRLYFQTLLKSESLNRTDRSKVMLAASKQISSDHEKANILKSTADLFLSDTTLSNALFQAIATINSDYEHRLTLSSLLKRKNLGEHVLSQMLASTAGISSDHEKANFLLEASSAYTGDARLRSEFLKTVDTIKSDHERGRVLSAMLRNKQIG